MLPKTRLDSQSFDSWWPCLNIKLIVCCVEILGRGHESDNSRFKGTFLILFCFSIADLEAFVKAMQEEMNKESSKKEKNDTDDEKMEH